MFYSIHQLKHSARGFTMIELLVAISIIAILSALIISVVFSARSDARDRSRVTDLQQYKLGLKLYNEANNEYPTSAEGGSVLGIGGAIDDELGLYVGDMKADPLSGGDSEYNYVYFDSIECDGTSRVVVAAAKVENEKYISDVCGGAAGEYAVIVK